MFCPNCGSELKDGDIFCIHCGKKVPAAPAGAGTDPADVTQHPSAEDTVIIPKEELGSVSQETAHIPVVPPVPNDYQQVQWRQSGQQNQQQYEQAPGDRYREAPGKFRDPQNYYEDYPDVYWPKTGCDLRLYTDRK